MEGGLEYRALMFLVFDFFFLKKNLNACLFILKCRIQYFKKQKK